MNGNRFGRLFQLTTFGESHGDAMGVSVADSVRSMWPWATSMTSMQAPASVSAAARST